MGGGGEWQKHAMYGSAGASLPAGSPLFGLRTHIPSSKGQWWPAGACRGERGEEMWQRGFLSAGW